jgi:hypothetical protein
MAPALAEILFEDLAAFAAAKIYFLSISAPMTPTNHAAVGSDARYRARANQAKQP